MISWQPRYRHPSTRAHASSATSRTSASTAVSPASSVPPGRFQYGGGSPQRSTTIRLLALSDLENLAWAAPAADDSLHASASIGVDGSRIVGSIVAPKAENTGLVGKLVSDISISLDGYITGPNDRPEEPMGEGGHVLHEWLFREYPGPGGPPVKVFEEVMAGGRESTGALLIWRRSSAIPVVWAHDAPCPIP